MSRHDPDLIKAHEANQKAIALASVSETAIRNFEAMTVGERRFQVNVFDNLAIQHDIYARSPGRDAEYHQGVARGHRASIAALKAIGL